MKNDDKKQYKDIAHFHKLLMMQKNTLNGEFVELKGTWITLKQTYDGDASEEFDYAWAQIESWFETYFEKLTEMSQFLEKYIQSQ